jgi:DNA polymerase-3 subunit delta
MILSPARALEKIGAGKIASGYLLLGRELYWRDRLWSALRRALALESSMTGLQDADLRQSSLDAVLSQAAERNLWSPRQLILVRSSHTISGAKPLESLRAYFSNPNPDTVLVFEMTDVDLDSEDWREKEKAKSRQQQWEDICEVVLLQSPSLEKMLELVRREAADRGCGISPAAAENLIAFTERDLGRIVKDLEKLCLYRPAGEEITEQDVELLAGGRGASRSLSLPEAVGTGKPAAIIEAFDDRVPKGAYLPLVLAELTRYLRQLLLLQGVRAGDARQASSILWNARLPAPQPLLPELVRQSRAMPPRHLRHCLQAALQAEVTLRSSPANDRLIVERFLLELARPFNPAPDGRLSHAK